MGMRAPPGGTLKIRRESYLILRGHFPDSQGSPLSLNAQDVARIADLARLALEPAEAARMLDSLNQVFGMIESLQAVDTSGVEPMTHALDLALRLRPDAVTEPDQRDDYQKVAPAVDRGLYLVPRVIE
jgi:aspartyl-tRNA(Asn)/glutamyl-tRNA(Gln) amidotransferase subunit C